MAPHVIDLSHQNIIAELKRLVDVTDNLIQEVTDPGTEALAAVFCARELIRASTMPAPKGLDKLLRPAGHCQDDSVWLDMGEKYRAMTRQQLCGGHMSDFEVAYDTAMIMRNDLNHEARLSTAKDRIRWLSVQLAQTTSIDLPMWRGVAARANKDLRALREQIIPFETFKEAFALELVKQFGDEVDKDGKSVRDYALEAAEGYYDDASMWEDGTIDAGYCAEADLQEWES